MTSKSKQRMRLLSGVVVAVALVAAAAYWGSREARIQRLLTRAEAGQVTAVELYRLSPLINRGPVSVTTQEQLAKTLVPLLEVQNPKTRSAAMSALVKTWAQNGLPREVKRRVVQAGIDKMQIMVKPAEAQEYTTDSVSVAPGSKLLFRFAFAMAGLPDETALSIRGPLTLNDREIMTIPNDGSAWYRGGGMDSSSYDLSPYLGKPGDYVLRWTTSDHQALGGAWRSRLKEALLPQDLLGHPLRSNEIILTVTGK